MQKSSSNPSGGFLSPDSYLCQLLSAILTCLAQSVTDKPSDNLTSFNLSICLSSDVCADYRPCLAQPDPALPCRA